MFGEPQQRAVSELFTVPFTPDSCVLPFSTSGNNFKRSFSVVRQVKARMNESVRYNTGCSSGFSELCHTQPDAHPGRFIALMG